MNKNTLTTLIIAVVFGVVGFLVGMKYQQSQNTSQRQIATFNGNGRQLQPNQRRNGNGNFGRPVVGEIMSVDSKTATVKMQDGSTKIVVLSDSTTYTKSGEATKDDLKSGVNIGVFGTDNSDGSVTAQNVQINPGFRFGGQNGMPSPTK